MTAAKSIGRPTDIRMIKMKHPSLLILLTICCCCIGIAMSQRGVGDDRPLRFQSFPSNPPQSFQQINFFGPLSPQQSADPAGSSSNRQALFFASQNLGQPDQRNPIFNSGGISPLSTLASSSIGTVQQRGQQIRSPTVESGFNPQLQLPTEVAANSFPSSPSRLTPASTLIQSRDPPKQKPIVQFQFNRDQVQPMNPAGNFNRFQRPELKLELLPELDDFPLPVPIGFRTPFFQQTTEAIRQAEAAKPQPSIQQSPPSEKPIQESLVPEKITEESLPAAIQEIPVALPETETNDFQIIQPVISIQQSKSPLTVELAATARPSQLQVLSDQPESGSIGDSPSNRRNRLRRPLNNNETPTTSAELSNSPRRVPPVREGNPNLRPVLIDEPSTVTTGSLRQRVRSSTTTSVPISIEVTTEAAEPVTIRTRQPFLRPRPSVSSRTRTNIRVFTTSQQPEEESVTTRAPSATRFFSRRPRPTLLVDEESEITTTTTERSRSLTTRSRNNFRFNSPVQSLPSTTTVKSVQFNSPELSLPGTTAFRTPVTPANPVQTDVLVNSVNDSITIVDQPVLIPTTEESIDATTPVVEDEYYYDDVTDEADIILTNDTTTTTTTVPETMPSSPPTTSTTTIALQELPAEEEIEPAIAVELPIVTVVEQPAVENDHKPLSDDKPIIRDITDEVASPQPLPVEVQQVTEADEIMASDVDQEVVEEEAPASKAPQTTNGPLKIFNLGRRNTSSVNLDNIVFVPNLDGFVLPSNPVTPNTVSVETSRSVTVVKMSVDQLPTESPSSSQSDRQSKAIASKTSNLADNQASSIDVKQPIKEIELAGESLLPEPTKAPDSRNDELDLIQSDLFDKHLNNNFNMEASKPSDTITTTSPTPTSSRPPFRPAFERPRRPFDFLETPKMESTVIDVPVTDINTPEQVEVVPSSTTEIVAVSSSTEEPTTTAIIQVTTTMSLFDRLFGKKVAVMDDISSLLPPGFSAPEPEAPVTEIVVPVTQPAAPVTETAAIPVELAETALTTASSAIDGPISPLDKILGSVKEDDISAFLPPGFKMDQPPTTQSTTTTTKGPFDGLFDTANMDDLSALLPPNFKHHLFTPSPSKTTPTVVTESPALVSTEATSASAAEPLTTTAKKGLVFPTRASPARTTTSEKPRVKPTQSAVEIKSGWPVRATTEFTGWPSPATQPYSPPSTTPTTVRMTTTTTKTTTTPRVTTVGQCGEECRLAGTIRLVEGIDWMPELSDHNTREWYQLAAIVENSLDAVYQSGPLAPWYAGIVVEAFSRGSVLVDYYLNLNGTTILDTGEIRNYFHMSLEKEGENYKLGNYTVDTKSTDFIVLRQPVVSGEKQRVVTGGVGEWVIAVIVVGLASLIFVIAFGTTMLIRRRRQHQRKPLPLTEEMLNELNKNHMSGAEHVGDSFYNDDIGDAWDHRTNFPTKPIKPLPRPASVSAIHQTSRTHGSSSGYNYNHYTNYNNFRPQLHDTWKSEWDSSYYESSNSGTAPRSSKTAPTRPATSYGRYPTYGRSRPTNFHDDF